MLALGPGALLAKIDVKEAYRNITIHPDDRHLLGISWNEKLFLDCQLPFGLRLAPVIFSAVRMRLSDWLRRTALHTVCTISMIFDCGTGQSASMPGESEADM